MTTQPFPGAYVPAVNPKTGFFTNPWIIYFQQISAQPGAPFSVPPSASPFSYIASGPGSLAIEGGTVSAVTLSRGGVSVSIGAQLVPMVNGDIATITYSVAPTLSFVPS